MAVLFEGGLALVAVGLGWLFDLRPLEAIQLEPAAVLWGFVGAAPLYAIFLLFDRYPVGPLRQIKDLLAEMLGPVFAQCRKIDLALVALMAGLGEELLFRGLLLPLTGGDSFLLGLLISSLIFGLAHAVTWSYVVLAALAGAFFALQWHYTGNLLTPIITHAVYDYLAFVKIARDQRPSAENDIEPNDVI